MTHENGGHSHARGSEILDRPLSSVKAFGCYSTLTFHRNSFGSALHRMEKPSESSRKATKIRDPRASNLAIVQSQQIVRWAILPVIRTESHWGFRSSHGNWFSIDDRKTATVKNIGFVRTVLLSLFSWLNQKGIPNENNKHKLHAKHVVFIQTSLCT